MERAGKVGGDGQICDSCSCDPGGVADIGSLGCDHGSEGERQGQWRRKVKALSSLRIERIILVATEVTTNYG